MMGRPRKAQRRYQSWRPVAPHVLHDRFRDHQESFPPVIINISDGAPNDDAIFNQVANQATEKWQFKLGDVSQTGLMIQSKAIRELGTNNGKCLVMNCHISATGYTPMEYPSSSAEAEAIDPFAKFMFEMSSIIPEQLREIGKTLGISFTFINTLSEKEHPGMYVTDTV